MTKLHSLPVQAVVRQAVLGQIKLHGSTSINDWGQGSQCGAGRHAAGAGKCSRSTCVKTQDKWLPSYLL